MSEPDHGLNVIALPSGVAFKSPAFVIETDWSSIQKLCESGVPISEVAREFKISSSSIKIRSNKEKWLVPSRIKSLRKKIIERQSENYARTGKHRDVAEIKAEIWEERGEALNEKVYNIVKDALEGLTPEVAKGLISEAKDLKSIVEVGRVVTGQEKKDKALEVGSGFAINIGLLHSTPPVEVIEIGDVQQEGVQ